MLKGVYVYLVNQSPLMDGVEPDVTGGVPQVGVAPLPVLCPRVEVGRGVARVNNALLTNYLTIYSPERKVMTSENVHKIAQLFLFKF